MKITIGIPLPDGTVVMAKERFMLNEAADRTYNTCQEFSAISGLQAILFDESRDGVIFDKGVPKPLMHAPKLNG